jgi:recombination protein RecA
LELDKQEAAKSILREVQQRWGDGALYTSGKRAVVQTLPTGYGGLDSMLSGIPRGHLTEFIGAGTCGMTTLALSLASKVQAIGEPVFYLDLRYSFDPYYAADHDVAVSKLILTRPAITLSGMDILYQLVAENAAGLVIVNSTADILASPSGSQVLAATLRKLSPALRKSACSVVFLTPTPATSSALAHTASLRLAFQHQAWIEGPDDVLGYETIVTVLKNRTGRPGQSVRLSITIEGDQAVYEEAA